MVMWMIKMRKEQKSKTNAFTSFFEESLIKSNIHLPDIPSETLMKRPVSLRALVFLKLSFNIQSFLKQVLFSKFHQHIL